MEVTRQLALKMARGIMRGRVVKKITPYYDNDLLNAVDYATDWCFGKSDTLYIGNLVFYGLFNYWDSYAAFTDASLYNKVLIASDKFLISDGAFDPTRTYKARNMSSDVVTQNVPLVLFQWDQSNGYLFTGWKVEFVAQEPYNI